ncbi:hypothetical protein GF1_11670 [Desulfolithobacter dissulfuricans]|uniref:Uncharacterized protein n=1 Tax=Desulfolithobacter dissulfuricans TaxID=2795293 RepID=A0A915TZP1_9BACT|nr:hypothetical protein [Desulfolithobacter dissulfuricans]BCO08791.1 hypothetical protein GF1_11670 [Desulfolithobacter dissulfuricans]
MPIEEPRNSSRHHQADQRSCPNDWPDESYIHGCKLLLVALFRPEMYRKYRELQTISRNRQSRDDSGSQPTGHHQ